MTGRAESQVLEKIIMSMGIMSYQQLSCKDRLSLQFSSPPVPELDRGLMRPSPPVWGHSLKQKLPTCGQRNASTHQMMQRLHWRWLLCRAC